MSNDRQPAATRQVNTSQAAGFEFRRPSNAPVWVENLFFSEQLTATERRVLLLIETYSTPFDDCFATNRRLAEWVGRDSRTVKRCLTRLRELDLIVCWGEREDRRMRVSWVPPINSEQMSGRDTGCPEGRDTGCPQEERQKRQTLNSVPRARDASGGPDVLIPGPSQPPPKKDATPSAEDLRYAETLREAVLKAGCSHRGWSRAAWAKEFTLLRRALGEDRPRLEQVLAWYTSRIGKEMVPQAFSAAGFRTKWDAIEAAFRRDSRRNPSSPPTPAAQKSAARLDRLGWPKGASDKLPSTVQAGLDNLAQFRKKVEGSIPALPKGLQRFAQKVLNGLLADPGEVVEGWMRSVNKRLVGWKEWSGEMGAWVWTPDRPEVVAEGRGYAERYCGDPRLWDQLMEALNDRA